MQLQDENLNVDAILEGDLENSNLLENEIELLKFCEKVTLHAYKTTPQDIENLRNHGWQDDQISEAVLVTGMFALFNRVADAFGLEDPGYRNLAKEGKAAIRPAEEFEN